MASDRLSQDPRVMQRNGDEREPVSRRSREVLLFLFLAVVIWPFIAVGVVSGWGFLVWMYYIFTGPPGPA